ncbi:MAG TPA: aminotransferase class V-fold PLP-dependent enzyme, partial [Candidatus Eisenbacteria bacterium]|nr:aminotransferase class V-fold PLP-dependent enzyme [Candidatus Eisenbacteria bacterium]
CDAVQAASTLPIDVDRLGVDFLSLSAHKLYGPKGAGALYVRKEGSAGAGRATLVPQLEGGGQETGLRSGTLNVPGIVGFGRACAVAFSSRVREGRRLGALRDRLLRKLRAGAPDCVVNGGLEHRLPQNLNVSFPGLSSGELLAALPGVALSSGSACLSSSPEKSYVLQALGVPPDVKAGAVRFGLGRFNTAAEIDWAADRVLRAARRLRRKN